MLFTQYIHIYIYIHLNTGVYIVHYMPHLQKRAEISLPIIMSSGIADKPLGPRLTGDGSKHSAAENIAVPGDWTVTGAAPVALGELAREFGRSP